MVGEDSVPLYVSLVNDCRFQTVLCYERDIRFVRFCDGEVLEVGLEVGF